MNVLLHIKHTILLLTLLLWGGTGFKAAAEFSAPPIFVMPDNLDAQDYVPGSVIFKLREEARPHAKTHSIDMEVLKDVFSAHKAAQVQKLFPAHTVPSKSLHFSGQPYVDLSLIYEATIPEGESVEKLINNLYATGLVEYAELRYLPGLLFEPNDPFIGQQYYLETIRAFDAWAIEQSDSTMVIAISDTGIDLSHPDLVNDIAYNWDDPINGQDSDNDGYVDNFYGWDLGENNNNPQYNVNAHGVHVAGIAGASTHNGTGMAGVGFNSRLLPIKISDSDGRLVKAYESIVYAADQGAQIINLSWGGALSPGQFGQDIINYAVLNRDAIVIAAAGNSNNQVRIFPASYVNALSVAATDKDDLKWANSSFGNLVDLSAPGANIFSTWPNGYLSSSGTSMAAPVVSGAAALLRSHFPHYSALQIAAQLKVTTDLIDTIPGNEDYAGLMGTGRLNLYRALTETHHPYIMLSGLEHEREYYRLFNPGESFELAARFKNILADADSVRAVISTASGYVEILSSEALLGDAVSMQELDNIENPFLVRIMEDIPASHEVIFNISFYTREGEFAGRESFSITFNLDYVNIQAGQILSTINSKGNVGYNYPNYNQGQGFVYLNTNQNRTMIKCSGFLAGISTSRVVDNIYGSVEGSFSNLLWSGRNARLVEEPALGQIQVSGYFTDSLATSAKVGLKVHYNIYAFHETPKDKFMILEYHIINTSGDNLPGFYAGFYADWVIQDVRNHRAAFDATHQMGYAFSANGGSFTAIQMLNHSNVRHYAFDNQGFGGSMKVDDGFTAFEKYTALKSSRDNAGFFDKDNDVSTLIGAGPFNFQPNDTLTVAFALLAGDHRNDLQGSAQLARMVYLGEEDDETLDVFDPDGFVNDILVSPNPAGEVLKVNVSPPVGTIYSARIYNMNASLVKGWDAPDVNPLSGELHLELSGLPSGVYILQIRTSEGVFSKKFIRK